MGSLLENLPKLTTNVTLTPPGELDEWWNAHIGWTGDREQVLRAARTRHAELLQRAKVQGWETQ